MHMEAVALQFKLLATSYVRVLVAVGTTELPCLIQVRCTGLSAFDRLSYWTCNVCTAAESGRHGQHDKVEVKPAIFYEGGALVSLAAPFPDVIGPGLDCLAAVGVPG
jgi:hypothetical protein